jgi:hypothetical protein
MKNTPTPRTTLIYEADKYSQGAFSAYENMRDLAKELEVELAEAIESREFQLKLNVELNEREKQTHTELTEQRDKLAEALERILNYQGRFAEEDPQSIAFEALAAVKGGSDA